MYEAADAADIPPFEARIVCNNSYLTENSVVTLQRPIGSRCLGCFSANVKKNKIIYVGEIQIFLMLKQVVRIISTVLKGYVAVSYLIYSFVFFNIMLTLDYFVGPQFLQ